MGKEITQSLKADNADDIIRIMRSWSFFLSGSLKGFISRECNKWHPLRHPITRVLKVGGGVNGLAIVLFTLCVFVSRFLYAGPMERNFIQNEVELSRMRLSTINLNAGRLLNILQCRPLYFAFRVALVNNTFYIIGGDYIGIPKYFIRFLLDRFFTIHMGMTASSMHQYSHIESVIVEYVLL